MHPPTSTVQRWSHSTNTKARLKRALGDVDITAIEADIMANRAGTKAIMSHHNRSSDLTLAAFLDACLECARVVHVKLDFKEMSAVRLGMPIVAAHLDDFARSGRCVYVNADVLPGPGCRSSPMRVDADEFIRLAHELCTPRPILSLGWRTGFSGRDTYSEHDVSSMVELLRRNGLLQPSLNIAFPVAARFVVRDVQALLPLLDLIPGAQLLVWTGTGEPAISRLRVRSIQKQLAAAGDRVAYDVAVATGRAWGLANDIAIDLFLSLNDVWRVCGRVIRVLWLVLAHLCGGFGRPKRGEQFEPLPTIESASDVLTRRRHRADSVALELGLPHESCSASRDDGGACLGVVALAATPEVDTVAVLASPRLTAARASVSAIPIPSPPLAASPGAGQSPGSADSASCDAVHEP